MIAAVLDRAALAILLLFATLFAPAALRQASAFQWIAVELLLGVLYFTAFEWPVGEHPPASG